MNEIKIFNNPDFGDIRTIIIDGEPWFCGKDVAGSLGYANEKNAVKRHCDDGEVSKQTLGVQTGTKRDGSPAMMNTELLFVNESGLYSLIFGSKLDSAKKFKKWVTSEVLPSIRKTGQYGQERIPMTIPEQIQLLAQGNVEVNKRVDALTERVDQIELDLPLLPIEADEIVKAVKRKGIEVMGGKQTPAYKNRSLRQRVYNDIYANLKHNFNVKSYKAIRRRDIHKAVEIVNEYKPPVFLADEIELINSQMELDLSRQEREDAK